jgi:hypothetical protein
MPLQFSRLSKDCSLIYLPADMQCKIRKLMPSTDKRLMKSMKINAIKSFTAQFELNAPIRLSVAAKVAFPDGTMTASGLRREAARGRLVVERIAGKDFTTLENVERMRILCRVQAKEPVFTSAGRDTVAESSSPKRSGSSTIESALSPQDALRARLKQSRFQSKP